MAEATSAGQALPPVATSENFSSDRAALPDSVRVEDVPLTPASPAPQMDWDKKIIKTADVSVLVSRFTTYDQAIHVLTKKYGAYIASEQQNKDNAKRENTISIKVPIDQFDAMLNSLNGTDDKVISKRIYTEDVTDQLVDTKARLDAKRQVRDRYLVLLKQSKSMKDIIEVQQEIDNIQEELEAAEGRVKYLSHQSAYSTINLTYFEYLDGSDGSGDSFVSRLKDALKEGGSMISSFVLLLASFWSLIIGVILTWWLVRRSPIRFVKR